VALTRPIETSVRLILVRHGESNSSVARTIGGYRSCTGLSPLGRRQSELLRDRWAGRPEFEADALVASNYRRAHETAEIIAPALGGLDVSIDHGFGELDPGEICDGMTFEEFGARYPSTSRPGPGDELFPGGETSEAFHQRVRLAVERIVTVGAGRTVVVVCHGGVVDAVMRTLSQSPADCGFEVAVANTSITELVMLPDDRWRLLRCGDVAHLTPDERES
jgi:broad specificity phosphatase PhoE